MNISQLALQQPHLNQNQEDAYVTFQLDQQTPAVLAMKHAQEVLVVPVGRITPMPNMPECVLGLLNRHSRVLWVINLAQMLKLQPIAPITQQYTIVIIKVGQVPLGLIVQEVQGVMRFKPDSIQSSPGIIPSNIAPYLEGCILQQKQILLVLKAEAIVNSPLLHEQ